LQKTFQTLFISVINKAVITTLFEKKCYTEMRRISIITFLVLNSVVLFSQTVLTIEGTTINSTVSGNWPGVNIPRNVPTQFTYRNNSITSVNTRGYMLQAGDEAPGSTNNKLDGEVITGNKFVWNGLNSPSVITHGLFAGYNINSVVRYNYLDKVPYGIIFKSGTDAGVNMTFTSGGCGYNICKNGKFGGRAKGINGVKFINNTFYSGDGSGWYLLLITGNMDRRNPAPSTGTKIFNNIFYSTIQIPMIKIESGCLANFECDYNIYWCSVGEPRFSIDGATITWAQWRARGYDAHSRIMNPKFINTIDFVPETRLDFGTDLGTEWQTGLSTTATWSAGLTPATANQNGTWQVGARIYSVETIHVSQINVQSATGTNSIITDKGTLQLTAEVLPANTSNKTVTWSITNGTGQAAINSSGLVTGITNGTVTAKASSNDGSGVSGTFLIDISGQIVKVSGISVSGAGGASIITAINGTLQLSAAVIPVNATDKNVTWTITNGTGQATINSSGLVTSQENGIVTATATANDGSGIFGSMAITISSQLIPVTNITVSGAVGVTTITSDNGTLQLGAEILPLNASDVSVKWSIVNNTGQALISQAGTVTAVGNGTVTAIATANDGSGVFGTLDITITNQIVPVASITVSGTGGVSVISSNNGTLQLNAEILPLNSTNKSVNWTIVSITGDASISSAGLVTALANGTVNARATAADGTGIYGTLNITISGQVISVMNISVTGENGVNSITEPAGSLQLNAEILPENATHKDVTWSMLSGSELASINTTGLLTAIDNGVVTAQATARDGSGVYGTLDISIDFSNENSYSVIVTPDEIKIIFYDDFISWIADLYNLQGNLIMRKNVAGNSVIFNTASLTAGIYIILLTKGELLIVEKVMVS
jgi:uncharacterized protein YjdB